MSEIITTEALVLSKLNYGDSSCITSLFTKELGRLSAIIKGGRSPKAKNAHIINPLNLINVVLYNKDTRDIQLISSADLIEYYPAIKENLEKLKYGYAVLELVKNLIPEHEPNRKLFKALERIMQLLGSKEEKEKVVFGKFFIFFISLLGYEIQLDKCADCGRATRNTENLSYNSQMGILCNNCSPKYSVYPLNAELFTCLKSLKSSQTTMYSEKMCDAAVNFMDQYLKTHITGFQGLQSLKILK